MSKLPKLLDRKIYKTTQTRGSDDNQIFQNRVKRNGTVLIPYNRWIQSEELRNMADKFENGYIVLISPNSYFEFENPVEDLEKMGLNLGSNLLIFYRLRSEWIEYNPVQRELSIPNSRTAPLGGEYVARIPNTTATDDERINVGFTEKSLKGAGIRLYEYAPDKLLKECRLQLEAIYWHCDDSVIVASENGMSDIDAVKRKEAIIKHADRDGLLDYDILIRNRILNADKQTICPFCLRKLSANGFYNRLVQPDGREVPDLTVTEINLFHIKELKYGEYNHKPYNLGWGCHHCNVVVKDSGIYETLDWIVRIINKNIQAGFLDTNGAVVHIEDNLD